MTQVETAKQALNLVEYLVHAGQHTREELEALAPMSGEELDDVLRLGMRWGWLTVHTDADGAEVYEAGLGDDDGD